VAGAPSVADVMIGILVPCFTTACMLFCVTTRGRDRTFSKPRDSAMVSRTSICMLLVALTKERPLVGPTAPRLENNGI